jgi:hypothetical protein
MRRSVAALLSVALVAAAAAVAATPARPVLRVVDTSPLVVVGQGFPAGQAVRLVTRARRVSTQATVHTDEDGRFRVVVERLTLTGALRCAAGVVISARTAAGRVVLWQPRGLPNCSTPLRPPSV